MLFTPAWRPGAYTTSRPWIQPPARQRAAICRDHPSKRERRKATDGRHTRGARDSIGQSPPWRVGNRNLRLEGTPRVRISRWPTRRSSVDEPGRLRICATVRTAPRGESKPARNRRNRKRAKHAGTHRGESGLPGRAVAVGHRAPVRGRRRRRPRLETDHPRRFRHRFPSLRLRHSRRHRTSAPGVCVAYSAEVSGVGHEGCSSHTNTTLPSLPVLLWVRLTTSFQSSRRTVRSTRALSVPSATSANRSR